MGLVAGSQVRPTWSSPWKLAWSYEVQTSFPTSTGETEVCRDSDPVLMVLRWRRLSNGCRQLHRGPAVSTVPSDLLAADVVGGRRSPHYL